MKDANVRAFIAITIVGVFMLITGFLTLYPLFANQAVDIDSYADFFSKTTGIYTGIVGVIIGYYFRGTNGESASRGEAVGDRQHVPKAGDNPTKTGV